MRTSLVFLLAFAVSGLSADQGPLKLPDLLAWKRIQTPVISRDGQWFAYKLVPNDGNSEVVLTHISDGKEQRFAIGQVVRPNPYLARGEDQGGMEGTPHDLAFSSDSKWFAFDVHPAEKELAVLKKQHKPAENKVVLWEIATEKKTEFERVKRFAFSGESSSAIALHRYGAAAAPDAGEKPKTDDKPQGSDLIVLELATSNQLSIGNVSDFAFNKKGDWLAWTVDAQDKLGNGLELRNMSTGAVMALDTAAAIYKGLNWTENGDGLTGLRGTEEKAWEDKLFTLVAFKNFRATSLPDKFSFDPAKDSSFPKGMTISPERRPAWMADLSTVTFGIHDLKVKEPKDEKSDARKKDEAGDPPADLPDLVVWNWKDRRLPSMQQVQENKDKNFSYLCSYQPAGQKFFRLADEGVRDVALVPEGKFGLGSDVREYEREANLDGKHYEDLYRVDPRTGERKLVLTKARWALGTSPDGTHLLHYQDGTFFTTNLETGETHNLTKGVPSVFFNTDDDHNIVKPPARTFGWSKDSQFVLISDNWDIWKVPANGGAAVNLTVNGRKEQIRYQTIWKLDAEEKGFDLSKPLFVRTYGEWTKKGGIGRIDPDKPGAHMLHWDDASYASLLKAKDADTFVYSRETTQEYGDFYSSGGDLTQGKQITHADPQQKDFLWTKGSRLVEYTGPKGDRLQGVIYLPANYKPGTQYPTVVYIYEKLSQAANSYPFPGVNGFSIAFYTSNGYAVLTPDISYKVNDPGVSAVTCILGALKAAGATGVVDLAHVALHGHSWGGYQTAFTVTQSRAFKAAIAGAPLTDMVSM
jgi:dipeptidyl aminopeptidase/acylaminoacyl peptidase